MPQCIKPLIILIRLDEPLTISLGYFSIDFLLYILISYETFKEFLTNIFPALRAVVQSPLNNTGSDWATLIDQFGIAGHTPVTANLC
jgi:hypothetical protein